jgi:hypothetical protein
MYKTVPDGKLILLDRAGRVELGEAWPTEIRPGHTLSRGNATFEFCRLYGPIALYIERSVILDEAL